VAELTKEIWVDAPPEVVYPSLVHPPGSTRVEFDVEPRDGGTQLRLRHRGLTGEASLPTARAGVGSRRSSRKWGHEPVSR
jgi:hypothetical protein